MLGHEAALVRSRTTLTQDRLVSRGLASVTPHVICSIGRVSSLNDWRIASALAIASASLIKSLNIIVLI
jgi:hypothetical protein